MSSFLVWNHTTNAIITRPTTAGSNPPTNNAVIDTPVTEPTVISTMLGGIVSDMAPDRLVNQVCRVNLNCQCQRGPDVFPFAGRKDSAEGTLSVSDALRAFSIRSMVAAKKTPTNEDLLDAIVVEHKSKFINTRFIF